MSDTTPPSTIKLVVIGLLAIALLIPGLLVFTLVEEREERQAEMREEVAASWGRPQQVSGPVLVLPVLPREGTARVMQLILPRMQQADAQLAPQTRRRGLFQANVYTASIDFNARFDTEPALPEGSQALWNEAYLLTAVSELRSAERPFLQWDDARLAMHAGEACEGQQQQLWRLGLSGPPAAEVTVTGRMVLRGSDSLHLRPLGQESRFSIAAPWPTPSFSGADLPERSEVTETGFRAEWSGLPPPQRLQLSARGCLNLAPGVGVRLIEAVPTYRMVTRATKYSVMFIALGFLTYLLFELLARVAIHPVQYGLFGASLVLFPLLLLAIAEVLGFATAYAIAGSMVMGQAGLYTLAVTRRFWLAVLLMLVLIGLFAFLYVVLSLESLALLTGAIALFTVLSALMLLTRRVRWG